MVVCTRPFCGSHFNLSAHADHRILKLARIIADLVGVKKFSPRILLQYREKLMMGSS
jgi:predicted ATPase with chaperone activity